MVDYTNVTNYSRSRKLKGANTVKQIHDVLKVYLKINVLLGVDLAVR
jgi:hypothetical protein